MQIKAADDLPCLDVPDHDFPVLESGVYLGGGEFDVPDWDVLALLVQVVLDFSAFEGEDDDVLAAACHDDLALVMALLRLLSMAKLEMREETSPTGCWKA
jgi:hypothetical protein